MGAIRTEDESKGGFELHPKHALRVGIIKFEVPREKTNHNTKTAKTLRDPFSHHAIQRWWRLFLILVFRPRPGLVPKYHLRISCARLLADLRLKDFFFFPARTFGGKE